MIKTCSVCDTPIGPRNRSGRCKKCYQKQWQKDNPKKVAAVKKKYREENHEKVADAKKKYRDCNSDKVNAYQKKYRATNLKKAQARAKKYREENRGKVNARNKKYRDDNPEKVREWRHDRRIYLCDYSECKKLNEWFPGCDAHHITSDVMMHIPAQMHNSVYHSLKTGQGMEEINRMAFEWLEGVVRESPQTSLESFV